MTSDPFDDHAELAIKLMVVALALTIVALTLTLFTTWGRYVVVVPLVFALAALVLGAWQPPDNDT
jgi:hypothetical protein